MNSMTIRFRLNGEEVEAQADPRIHAIDFLREQFELSSPRVGCEHGVCGACTIRVDGQIIRGCLMLSMQLDGTKVDTLEGLTAAGEIADLQEAFVARNAVQCGFCTSGMLLTGQDFLSGATSVSREAIREHLSGNYCRCTGYEAIVDAIESVARRRGIRVTGEAS